MSQRYLDADQIREIEEALRFRRIEDVAGQVGIDPQELAVLLGRPAWKPIPSTAESVELDLFDAEEKLEGVL